MSSFTDIELINTCGIQRINILGSFSFFLLFLLFLFSSRRHEEEPRRDVYTRTRLKNANGASLSLYSRLTRLTEIRMAVSQLTYLV